MEGAGRICAAGETAICLTGDQDGSEQDSGLCEAMHVQVGNTVFNVGAHACKYVC